MKQEGLSDTQALPIQQLTIHKLPISWHTEATNCSAWSQKSMQNHQPNIVIQKVPNLQCLAHVENKENLLMKKTGEIQNTSLFQHRYLGQEKDQMERQTKDRRQTKGKETNQKRTDN